MAEIGAPLAGEMSAHIFFKHRYYGYDDALYAAVRLLNVLNGTDDSLADLLDAMPKTVSTPGSRSSAVNCATAFSPSPSMRRAVRDARCRIRRSRCAGQSRLTQKRCSPR